MRLWAALSVCLHLQSFVQSPRTYHCCCCRTSKAQRRVRPGVAAETPLQLLLLLVVVVVVVVVVLVVASGAQPPPQLQQLPLQSLSACHRRFCSATLCCPGSWHVCCRARRWHCCL